MNHKQLLQKGLLVLACLSIVVTATAQDWQQKQALPAQGRDHPVGFGLNNKGYAMVGMVETFNGVRFLDDFYEYLPAEDRWEAKNDFPGPARGFSIGTTHRGKGYIGFGAKFNRSAGRIEPLKDVWEYNPELDSWQKLPDCPCDARRHPAMEAANGKLYVGLGDGANGNLKDWWVLDLDTEEWAQLPDMPGPARHHPYHFTINGKVYAGMGHGAQFASGSNASGILNDWYVFDPADSAWTKLSNFPGQARVAGTQFSHGDKGYVLSGDGGDHSYMDSGEFWQYEPTTDEWTAMPAHLGVSLWAPTSFIINDQVHMVGGLNRQTSSRDPNVYAFDLSRSTGKPALANQKARFSVYPNPASDQLHFQLKGHQIQQVSIRTIKGRTLKQGASNRNQLNVNDLESGLYLLRLQDEQGEWHTNRFIKQ